MQFCVYFNMIFVLFVGSRIIITNGGTTIDVGQLSAMLTYGMQILMSLMMISMIYVMMTMSYESFVRICEVLEEEPALTDPASPALDVKDGSIDFENVSFKYSAQAKKFALQDINLAHRLGHDRRHPRRYGLEQVDPRGSSSRAFTM